MSNSGRYPKALLHGSWRLVQIMLLGAMVVGCGPYEKARPSPATLPAGQSPRMLLYCGAGIRPAADDLVKAFEREHDVTIECDYDGTERLLARIKLSGIGDLYMPGDRHYVEQAAEQGLIAAHENVCYLVPVILVRKGNPKNIRALDDLARPGLEVGLGNPQVCAIGRTSVKIFEKNRIPMDDVLRNVQFQALTVNDLGNHIRLGQLDAVIVWDAMAAYFAEFGDVVGIPSDQNVISTVAIGTLTSSERPELARRFLEFAASEQGAEIFARHHYTTRLPEAKRPSEERTQ